MHTEFFYENHDVTTLKEITERYKNDTKNLREGGGTHLYGPESINSYNDKFGTHLTSLDQLKDLLYLQISQTETTKNEKLKLLALVNPDKLWIDYGDTFGNHFTREDIVIVIAECDPTLLTEDVYWETLEETEKSIVMRSTAKVKPAIFLRLGWCFRNLPDFQAIAKTAIENLEPNEALSEYTEQGLQMQYLNEELKQNIQKKVLDDINSLCNIESGNFKGLNPYLYIDKLEEQKDIETAMIARDYVLEQVVTKIEPDIDKLLEQVKEVTLASGYDSYVDSAYEVVRMYMNEKFRLFDAGGANESQDKKLISLYVMANLEQKLRTADMETQFIGTEITCPPNFLEKILSLDALGAKTNLLAWTTNVNLANTKNSEIILHIIHDHFSRIEKSKRLLSDDSFTDWDIVRLITKYGSETNIEKLVNDLITPEMYIYMIHEHYADSITTTRQEFISKVSDEQKMKIYQSLDNSSKLKMLVLDDFEDKQIRKKMYKELLPQLEDFNLAYGDFLFLRNRFKTERDESIKQIVKLYSLVGRNMFVQLEKKFGDTEHFFGKTNEQINSILDNFRKIEIVPRELLLKGNKRYFIDKMTPEDADQFNKTWKELKSDPNKLDLLLQLRYLYHIHGKTSWNFGKAQEIIIRQIEEHGLNGFHEFLANASINTIDKIYNRTHAIDSLVVPQLSQYDERLSHPKATINLELARLNTIDVVSRRVNSISRLFQEYLTYKHMTEKYGYSHQELSDLLDILSSDIYIPRYTTEKGGKKTITLSGLYSAGLMGNGAKFLSQNIAEIKEILSQGVTYDGDILEYFDVQDPKKSLESLRMIGGKYVTDINESERLAMVLVSRVLKNDNELYYEEKFQSRELVEKDYLLHIKIGLEAALNWTTDKIKSMDGVNRIETTERSLAFSSGDLVHWVSEEDGALGILKSKINYPKEFLGQKVGGTDSYPGYVDCQLVDDLIINELGNQDTKNRKSYMPAEAFAFVYRAQGIHTDNVPTSTHHNHKLVPGALSFTQMKSIICSSKYESDTEFLYKLKKLITMSGLYTPIYASNGKDLLFTPEEFDKIVYETPVFKQIEDLMENNSVFVEIESVKNTDGKNTILEHCNDVKNRAKTIATDLNLDPVYITLAEAAAKLHDVGKNQHGSQEINNVVEAERYLDMVVGIDIETKKKILLLVRNDELLGEILKEYSFEEKRFIGKRGKEKWKQFNSIFATDPSLKKAMIALYLADVDSYGDQIVNDTNKIREKMQILGLIQ